MTVYNIYEEQIFYHKYPGQEHLKKPAFDIETSIAYIKPLLKIKDKIELRKKNLDLEIYRELYKARKALEQTGSTY